MVADEANNMETTTAAKPPTTFRSLPAELRNYIYDLSGCLQIVRCYHASCKRATTRDISEKYFMKCYGQQYGRARVRCLATSSPWTLIPVDIRGTGRQMIYYDSPKDTGTLRWSAPAAKQPALTKVSRSIRQETLPMFYGQNRFVIWTYEAANAKAICRKFLNGIGRSNAGLLRNLIISVKSIDEKFSSSASAYSYLKAHGLKQLQNFTTEVRESASRLRAKEGVLFYMEKNELDNRREDLSERDSGWRAGPERRAKELIPSSEGAGGRGA